MLSVANSQSAGVHGEFQGLSGLCLPETPSAESRLAPPEILRAVHEECSFGVPAVFEPTVVEEVAPACVKRRR
jgi:hypothetical protein